LALGGDWAIVLSAYAKWGEQCGPYLLGDFAFAIWDASIRRLFCCRDHLAAQPFFYWYQASRFIFAADPSPILKVPGITRNLNRAKLAAMSVLGGKNLRDEETFYSGILSLPAGSCMSVHRGGMRRWAYWDPESSPVSGPKRDEEVFEALRELIFTSVRERIRNRKSVGALLSGGLDSSSVVAVAAECLKKENRSLVTLSSVMPEGSPAGLSDEREYIGEFRGWPNIRMEYCTAPGRGPFDHIEDAGFFESSFIRSSRYYLYEAFQEAGAANSLDVILEGVGGELGPTCWGLDYFPELAVRLRWVTLARELARTRAVRGTHPIRLLGARLRRSLFPNRGFRPLLLFNAEFIRDCDARHVLVRHWPNHRRSQLELLWLFRQKHANGNLSWPPPPIPFAYPFIDKRVVEFCIAAPTRLKVRDGYERCLIRAALDKILPSRIQWRTDKKPFAPDYFVRYNEQLPGARDFVAQIRPSDPVRSVVDVERLSRRLAPVDPLREDLDALISIPGTIYLIAFLRQFAEFRQ